MDNVTIKNPHNMSTIWIWSMISIIGFVISNIWIYAEGGFDWFGIVIGLILALSLLLAIPFNLEFIKRPYEVEIIDSGFYLNQRLWRKPVYIIWSGINKINFANIEPNRRNWNTSDGYLFTSEKKVYILNWKICFELRERYRTQFGSFPPNQSDRP